MSGQKRNASLWPPADHWITVWGSFVLLLVVALMSQLFSFFSRLTGAPWMWCYFVSLTVGALGVSLIFYAKVPLYRERRFFTFGVRALPEQRRPFYRWGYCCVVLAVVLLLCLLLQK